MKEKDRKSKVIEIVALIIAILVLLFCFWSYSKVKEVTLKDTVDVSPEHEDFNIIFTPTLDDKVVSDKGTKELVGISSTGESSGEAHVIRNKKNTIANIQSKLTSPGQEVVFTFYSHNKGRQDVYLNAITYSNVNGENFFRKCTAINPNSTNKYLISSACEDISMVVKVGDNVVTNGSITGIDDHKLDVNSSEKVTIIIKYDTDGTQVDGDFVVEFGAVTLTYLSKLEMEVK